MPVAKKSQKSDGPTAGNLTTIDIKTITDKLVVLREELRSNGATALTPNAEWARLRSEIVSLNKTLNADTAAKARRAV